MLMQQKIITSKPATTADFTTILDSSDVLDLNSFSAPVDGIAGIKFQVLSVPKNQNTFKKSISQGLKTCGSGET